MKTERLIKPIHPGEILRTEFLEPMNISQYRVAKEIHVPARRINQIIKGKRAITVDTAIRLSLFFGTSSHFWLGLQKDYDLAMVSEDLHRQLKKEVHPWPATTLISPL